MTKSTTGLDIIKIILGGTLLLAVFGAIIYIVKLNRRYAAERAAETERILQADINMMGVDGTEDVLERYREHIEEGL